MNGPDHIGGPIWQHRKFGVTLLAGEREYKGTRFFDVREWVEGDPMIPSKGKGVTIPLAVLESFHAALGDYLKSRKQ